MANRSAPAAALFQLRARWALCLLFGLLAILTGRIFLAAGWPVGAADDWALLAVFVFFAQLALVWFDLPRNISNKSRRLLPRFGPGTWLSLLRLLALSMLAGFLWPPRPAALLSWFPLALYFLFNLADLADGYAARRSGILTPLGEKLDLDLDGRGVLVAALLATHYGAVGWWYLLVGLARYVFVFAGWLQRQLGGRFKQQANPWRRPLAGVQMGIGVALLAPQLPTALTSFVAALSTFPFLGNFLFDWLTAIGWLRFKNCARPGKTWLVMSPWGLLITRIALAFLLILRVSIVDVYFVLDILIGLVLLFGLAGRTAAFALLLETGFRLQGQGVQNLDFAILFAGLILLYLGTGEFSFHSIKEGWIFRRWGRGRA